jgi:hypothetical protein
MAKSIIGVDGDVDLPAGHNAKIDSFQFTAGRRPVPTTGFGDTHETVELGLAYSAGSCGGTPQYDATTTKPGFAAIGPDAAGVVGGTLTLTFATGCTVAQPVKITDLTGTSVVDGAARISFNWLGSGVITETWDEGGV